MKLDIFNHEELKNLSNVMRVIRSVEPVLRHEAGPSPGANKDSLLLLDVEGPSSSEQDSAVSLGGSNRFLAGQFPPEERRWPLLLGVFSQEARPLEDEEAAWVALRSVAGGVKSVDISPGLPASASVPHSTKGGKPVGVCVRAVIKVGAHSLPPEAKEAQHLRHREALSLFFIIHKPQILHR
ncbi:hypothetical protein EYF80_052560 [Liparis tanakae]|uniref:Uncharacterized protein n=1 Tax=Liparis tanakae TaxID=230148 RepID=A0A4Z2F7U9_9TELE|nr:hypothetical protein EYF80_052560 [Liparis tanakae]